MPQLLTYLGLDNSDVNALDFGTLLVYSCPENCSGSKHLIEEVVWRQDFSQDGIGNQWMKDAPKPLNNSVAKLSLNEE